MRDRTRIPVRVSVSGARHMTEAAQKRRSTDARACGFEVTDIIAVATRDAVVVTPVSSNTGIGASAAVGLVIRTKIGSPFIIAEMETALATGRILHLRPSGNAPELRFYAEAESPAAAALPARGLQALRAGRLRS